MVGASRRTDGGLGSGRMRAAVAVLLASGLGAEGALVAPETVANVSMLLAWYFEVDCVQIFRSDDLPLAKVEEIHRTWKTLAVTRSKITTGVYTYRRYLRKKSIKPRKVSCYRSLKIMSDDEESKIGYAQFSMKFSIKDAVWVLYTESFSLGFFQDARIVFDDLLIIAEVLSSEAIAFHEVYKVSSGLPLRVLSLGNWTKTRGLQMTEERMYDRRWDLEGLALRTASVQNWPASYFRDGKWQGFLIKLWREIESMINCTSVDVEGENLVGTKLNNGSWNGLVGMALRNEIDVLVAEVVIDKQRSHALNFFHPIMKTRFQIYTRHLGYQWQWASILKPFNANVWAAAVAWVLAATLFWTFVHRLCTSRGLGSMDFGRRSPADAFFFVVQALCQQGYHHQPSSYACRVFFFVSYAVSSVLIPSYSASLVSILAQKIHLKSFDSLQEMVADGSYRLMVKENTAQHSFFAHSTNEFFKLAYEKLVKPVPERLKKMGFRESMKALCHLDRYAVMAVEDIVENRLQHLISLDCPVVHLTFPVSTIYLTMATARNNPYWGLINHHLGKLLNTGVVERLRRSEFPLGDHAHAHLADSEVEVGMLQVVSAFLFIGGFAVISVFLLFVELRSACCKALGGRPKRKKRALRSTHFLGSIRYEMKMQRYLRTRPRDVAFPDFFPK